MGCVDVTTTCPCWQIDKCIQICQLEGVSELSPPDSASGCTDDTECVVSTLPGSVTECCKEVSICLDSIDILATRYSITVTRADGNIIYSFSAQLCNLCPGIVIVNSYSSVVEENVSGAMWTPITSTKKNVIAGYALQPSECRNFIVSGGLSPQEINLQFNHRIVFKVYATVPSDTIIIPFPEITSIICGSDELVLVDEGNTTPITESTAVCLDFSYQPVASGCQESIINTVSLFESPQSPASEPIAQSSTKINIVCPVYTLTGSAALECGNVNNTCALSGSFTFSVSCISYTKRNQYVVVYGNDTIIQAEVITLNPNKLTETILFSKEVQFILGAVVRVVVSSLQTTYNLSLCTSVDTGFARPPLIETITPIRAQLGHTVKK